MTPKLLPKDDVISVDVKKVSGWVQHKQRVGVLLLFTKFGIRE